MRRRTSSIERWRSSALKARFRRLQITSRLWPGLFGEATAEKDNGVVYFHLSTDLILHHVLHQKRHIELRVLGNKISPAHEVEKLREDLLEKRCVGHHFVGDAMHLRRFFRNDAAGIYQRVEGIHFRRFGRRRFSVAPISNKDLHHRPKEKVRLFPSQILQIHSIRQTALHDSLPNFYAKLLLVLVNGVRAVKMHRVARRSSLSRETLGISPLSSGAIRSIGMGGTCGGFMQDIQYDQSVFKNPRWNTGTVRRVHLISDPFLFSILARLCIRAGVHPAMGEHVSRYAVSWTFLRIAVNANLPTKRKAFNRGCTRCTAELRLAYSTRPPKQSV
jgi:hypothetical protein